jgi:hypothetical protein
MRELRHFHLHNLHFPRCCPLPEVRGCERWLARKAHGLTDRRGFWLVSFITHIPNA